MVKFFYRFFLILLFSLILIIGYLSFFGLETEKFDNLIKEKANEVNQSVKLEFKNTKIHINIRELDLAVKLQNPKIIIKNNEVILSKIDLFLPLRSFVTSDFILKKAEIAFLRNDIKDLEKVSRIFVPKFISKRINKIFTKGELNGELTIPFGQDGKISKDYKFVANLLKANVNISSDFKIKNLSTEIKYFNKSGHDKTINLFVNKGSILNLDLSQSSFDVNFDNGEKIIKSKIKTTGSTEYKDIKKIALLFGFNLSNIKSIEFNSNLETLINLKLNDKFKIIERYISVNGLIKELSLQHEEFTDIKNYLPEHESKISFKDTTIKIDKDKKLELVGLIKFDKKFENFSLKYRKQSDKFSANGKISFYEPLIKIKKLNFQKKPNTKADLEFDITGLKKSYNINKLVFLSNKSRIEIDKVKLNKKFELVDILSAKIVTFSKNNKNNDFLIKSHQTKKNTISINGDIFDASPLLKTLYKKDNKKTFSNKFNKEIKVNFNKTLTGSSDEVFDFAMIASVKKGSFNKLSLKGNFSSEEIIEMSIYQLDNDKKTLQVISDRAKPFIKDFNFIEGFEGGKLEYESIISKKDSKSKLLITDFKVSKVPVLAKVLTLASLQGIADTLSGEGIRFESFEMQSNIKGNVLNIEDALAFGPAVSILLQGYVDKGKIVSLRGTLVPATKLNAIIASIPIVGDILVGKKTGEGVVGVSFKMKGPPKDIKTTVNPIKTLTPRFIVRAVEKMKRKKKEETK